MVDVYRLLIVPTPGHDPVPARPRRDRQPMMSLAHVGIASQIFFQTGSGTPSPGARDPDPGEAVPPANLAGAAGGVRRLLHTGVTTRHARRRRPRRSQPLRTRSLAESGLAQAPRSQWSRSPSAPAVAPTITAAHSECRAAHGAEPTPVACATPQAARCRGVVLRPVRLNLPEAAGSPGTRLPDQGRAMAVFVLGDATVMTLQSYNN